MINGNAIRAKLIKNESKNNQPIWVDELHALYELKPKIEYYLSAIIETKADVKLNGVRFYDDLLGKEFETYKSSLKELPLEIVADHICNWLYLNEYEAKFKVETINDSQRITFVVLWFSKSHPKEYITKEK